MDTAHQSTSSPLQQAEQQKSRTVFHGRVKEQSWEKPALLILLIITAIAYIWGLNQSGWSNSFYSAAVQAGTKSWKAFFFGSIDAANFITVDKPPASLWIMDISARIFGLNSWSILVPEALEGVATVWILYYTIRRWFSPGAALLAGGILAMTPVAALMFRFNNPDALLVLLLTASAYFLTRALEAGKTKWLIWASVLIGFGFLTKMLAAFIVIPGFVLVYLLFGPVSVRRRITQILMSAVTVLVSAGWWVAIVQLTPSADRPYIGSSQDNNILNLIFGYNGLGRLTGKERGNSGMSGGHFSGGGNMQGDGAFPSGNYPGGNMASHGAGMGGHGGGMFGGSPGITRLFQSDMGGQISWLIPAALILLVFSLWMIRRNWRKERALPALTLWATTLIVTGIVFSFGHGIIHQYYTIALAPSIGALVAISADVLWGRRDEWIARIGLALAVAATAVWSYVLLDRSPTWLPWLRMAILIIGFVAGLAIIIKPWLSRKLVVSAAVAAIVAGLLGPVAYTIDTVKTPHTGATPTAGPSVRGGGFQRNSSDQGNRFQNGNFNQGGLSGGGRPGGGFGRDTQPSQAIVQLLQQNASEYTWVAATVGAMSSAPYQLATDEPVMDIGGFSGSDPTPTLTQFQSYVSDGKIHYFIADGRGFGRGGFGHSAGNFQAPNSPSGSTTSDNASDNSTNRGGRLSNGQNPTAGSMGRAGGNGSSISSWVESNFKSTTVGGVTVYDLTQPSSSSTN